MKSLIDIVENKFLVKKNISSNKTEFFSNIELLDKKNVLIRSNGQNDDHEGYIRLSANLGKKIMWIDKDKVYVEIFDHHWNETDKEYDSSDDIYAIIKEVYQWAGEVTINLYYNSSLNINELIDYIYKCKKSFCQINSLRNDGVSLKLGDYKCAIDFIKKIFALYCK